MILAIVILMASLIMLGTFILMRSGNKVDDLPGKVIGENPKNIPESQLPVCDFTGAGFKEQPCYSPPGSLYF